jgi:hypothetical protein
MKVRGLLEGLRVDGNIILNRIGNIKTNLKEISWDDTGFVWLSVGSRGMFLQTR